MKYIGLFFSLLIVFISGCSKFFDINHDPNNPEESKVELVFPAAVENTANVFGGSWLILGEIWSQHWTSAPNAPSFQAEDSYEVTAGDYSYDLRGWEYLYSGALMDYEWVRNTAKADENWNYYLMATVMQCYTYEVIADLFDQIPLSDALNKLPAKFDTGPQVYDALISRINEALEKDLSASKGVEPSIDDLVFEGNMNDWIAFANTLKLKIYLRQRFVPERVTVVTDGIQALYNGGALFLDKDAMMDDFANESGRDNYVYAIEFRTGNTNMRASKTILEFLLAEEDPRLDTLFVAPASGHAGMYQGDFRNVYSYPGVGEPELSRPYITPTQPVIFLSAAESYFLQAEACLAGFGTGDDKALYEMGIEEHFRRVGTAIEEDSIFEVDGYAEYIGTDEQKLEKIIVQKWISFTNSQGMEAFLEHNRTGYPRESAINPRDEEWVEGTHGDLGYFILSITSFNGDFPRRLLYPSSEQSKNPNTPPVQSINVPVWWNTRVYPY